MRYMTNIFEKLSCKLQNITFERTNYSSCKKQNTKNMYNCKPLAEEIKKKSQ